jgi:2Fe-2S ferredoxin
MSDLIIKNLNNRKVRIDQNGHSLLELLQGSRIDLMHACGGKGRCTTCKLEVLMGYEGLQEPSAFEKRCKEAGILKPNERLACQSIHENGDVMVSIPEEYKLPHISYSDQ